MGERKPYSSMNSATAYRSAACGGRSSMFYSVHIYTLVEPQHYLIGREREMEERRRKGCTIGKNRKGVI